MENILRMKYFPLMAFFYDYKKLKKRWRHRMIVYKTSPRESIGTHVVYVEPGREHDVSEWKNQEGKPIQIKVEFKHGKADVPNNLGEYLLANKLAERSRLILPQNI
jgi:hypothetical protein